MWSVIAILDNTDMNIFITTESSSGQCYLRGNYSSPTHSAHAMVELILSTAAWMEVWHTIDQFGIICNSSYSQNRCWDFLFNDHQKTFFFPLISLGMEYEYMNGWNLHLCWNYWQPLCSDVKQRRKPAEREAELENWVLVLLESLDRSCAWREFSFQWARKFPFFSYLQLKNSD